jgi:hypothetical protein
VSVIAAGVSNYRVKVNIIAAHPSKTCPNQAIHNRCIMSTCRKAALGCRHLDRWRVLARPPPKGAPNKDYIDFIKTKRRLKKKANFLNRR